MKKSLTEFAKAIAPPTRCKVCTLEKSLRAEVESGIKNRTSDAVIAAWLRNRGVAIGESSVKRHRREHLQWS